MKYTNRGEIVIEQRKLVNKLTKKGYPIVRIRRSRRIKKENVRIIKILTTKIVRRPKFRYEQSSYQNFRC